MSPAISARGSIATSPRCTETALPNDSSAKRRLSPTATDPLAGMLAWKGSTDQASASEVSRSTGVVASPVPTRSPVTSAST